MVYSPLKFLSNPILTICQEGAQCSSPFHGPPRLVKLIPDDPTTRPVVTEDIEKWRSSPEDLIGKAFISHDGTQSLRVFLVLDYVEKKRGGCCYEVQYEETGPDIFTFDVDDVLQSVAEADLVVDN